MAGQLKASPLCPSASPAAPEPLIAVEIPTPEWRGAIDTQRGRGGFISDSWEWQCPSLGRDPLVTARLCLGAGMALQREDLHCAIVGLRVSCEVGAHPWMVSRGILAPGWHSGQMTLQPSPSLGGFQAQSGRNSWQEPAGSSFSSPV